jgi:hypothetical protein
MKLRTDMNTSYSESYLYGNFGGEQLNATKPHISGESAPMRARALTCSRHKHSQKSVLQLNALRPGFISTLFQPR